MFRAYFPQSIPSNLQTSIMTTASPVLHRSKVFQKCIMGVTGSLITLQKCAGTYMEVQDCSLC